MLTPKEKGNALELAVHAIESAIIKASPSYQEKTFAIDSNKIVTVAGVRHEIDIWVSVDLGSGYTARFIFECKNQEERVGKNEIIVFAEKIKAVQAQSGFFVAKSFTADAEAQAPLEPRITLYRVTDLPVADVPMPLSLHGVTIGRVDVEVAAFLLGADEQNGRFEPVDLSAATLMIDGVETSAESYVGAWVTAERDRCVNTFSSPSAQAGTHDLSFEAERSYSAGAARLNGGEIARLRMVGHVQVTVSKPRIISHFEVATRGRAIVTALDNGGGEVKVVFTGTPRS